jgi:hypothetical protein
MREIQAPISFASNSATGPTYNCLILHMITMQARHSCRLRSYIGPSTEDEEFFHALSCNDVAWKDKINIVVIESKSKNSITQSTFYMHTDVKFPAFCLSSFQRHSNFSSHACVRSSCMQVNVPVTGHLRDSATEQMVKQTCNKTLQYMRLTFHWLT